MTQYYDNQQPQQPVQPQQPQAYTQPQPPMQAPHVPQGNSSFIADAKTRELLGMVHPELTSAMINIAVKKFAESTDFMDYFVQDQFKEVAAVIQKEEANTQSAQKEQSAPKESSAPGMDFTSW